MSRLRWIKKERKLRRTFNKYSLCALICGVGISSINLIDGITSFEEISVVTEFDEKYREEFLEEYEQIPRENITFENSELFDILKSNLGKEELTSKDLLSFLFLSLEDLKDENLSDLKYLPNLEYLEIKDMYVDAQQLQFNQNIKNLSLSNVDLYNTFYLPNTIENLRLTDSTVIDVEFMIPYQVEFLSINNVIFNNLNIKNPQRIKKIDIYTWSLLDLIWIKECSNLKSIDIQYSPNIKNAQVLEEFIQKCEIFLDDYSAISISTSTLEKIYGDRNKWVNESKKLDLIANTLLEETETEEDKVKAITIYLLKKYRYDKDATKELVLSYNEKPIYYALNQEEVICVNYACLFSALANRMGLTNYQYEGECHTWNEVEINGEKRLIDITSLDSEKIILYEYLLPSEGGNKIATISYRPATFFLENGNEDRLAHYLFTEKEATYLENPSENYLVEIETRNKNIGYIQEKKEILKSYRLALSSLIITFLSMAFLQRQKRVMVERLKAEEEKEKRKKLRRNN